MPDRYTIDLSIEKSTISGYETMRMIRKGQVENLCKNDPVNQIKFIDNLFGIVA